MTPGACARRTAVAKTSSKATKMGNRGFILKGSIARVFGMRRRMFQEIFAPRFSGNIRWRKPDNLGKYCRSFMSSKHPADLHGLDPRELLMRGIATVAPRVAADWTPPSVEELAPLFPGYEIQALLGRGGMGAVYRARQPALD